MLGLRKSGIRTNLQNHINEDQVLHVLKSIKQLLLLSETPNSLHILFFVGFSEVWTSCSSHSIFISLFNQSDLSDATDLYFKADLGAKAAKTRLFCDCEEKNPRKPNERFEPRTYLL